MVSPYVNHYCISPIYDNIFGNPEAINSNTNHIDSDDNNNNNNNNNNNSDNGNSTHKHIKQMSSVIATSIASTYLSHPLHNLQITMQSQPSVGYAEACRILWSKSGTGNPSFLFRGAEARVGLLLVINVFNELLLKPAWAPIEVDQE